ncbi:MAG: Lrp/AsnC family transcriptional regulator [Clostridiales bacterium]|jgi:DNA-binding Lrp family transcriptional regulator|nr:Lrp/AsnC family transcriptional regulator [Clostridiales bacterium]
MTERILRLLEKDARLGARDIAVMTGSDESGVAAEIARLTEEGVIRGYNTLINWDKAGRESVTALIEVRVVPQRDNGFDQIARRIYQFEEVKALYLMSGGFDLTVIIESRSIREIASFVADKLAPLPSVTGTATHFVLKKYKDNGTVFDSACGADARLIVSP